MVRGTKDKIIIVGAVYYENLGDAALCYSAQKMLSDRYDTVLIDIYGRTKFPEAAAPDPENCYNRYKKIVRRQKLRDALLHVGIVPYDKKKKRSFEAVTQQINDEISKQKPAAVVFAGGALLKGVFLNSVERIVALADKNDIPVVFNACGIDSSMLPAEWKKLYAIFRTKAVKYISVRDGLELLKKKFPDIEIHDTMDPALCIDRLYEKNKTRSDIGLGIMLFHGFDFNVQYSFWKALVEKLNKEGCSWRMFTNGAPADQNFASYMLDSFGESRDRLAERPVEPAELYSLISGFDMIVSMRLHSHILAYASDTPSIAVSWDSKLNEFFDKIGKSSNCLDFSASADEVFERIAATKNDENYFAGKDSIRQIVEDNFSAVKNAVG